MQWPLKQFIYEYTRDQQYRDEKTKERSLRLTNRTPITGNVGLDENFNIVRFGTHSICVDLLKEKYGAALGSLVLSDEELAGQTAQGKVWTGLDSEKIVEKAFLRRKGKMMTAIRGKKTLSTTFAALVGVAGIWAYTHQLKGGLLKRIRKRGSPFKSGLGE